MSRSEVWSSAARGMIGSSASRLMRSSGSLAPDLVLGTLLGACDARAREPVLEELPAISDRGGVGGSVRAKQGDL
jgi:hypothetical protein